MQYYPALDGVRGIAILAVLAMHTFLLPTATGFAGVVTKVTRFGWVGVDLFFVLSGFLITGILLQTAPTAAGLGRFYVRRMLRTWPLYYTCFAVAVFVLPYSSLFTSTALDYIVENQCWYWLHGANLLHAFSGKWGAGFVGHFWSLAVEEQFYLAWPAVVLGLGTRWKFAIPVTCILLIITGISLRIGLTLADAKPLMIFAFTLCKADSLAWGSLVAWSVSRHGPQPFRKAAWAVALLASVAITVVIVQSHSFQAWGLPFANILFASAIVLSLKPGPIATLLLARGPLPFFGRYSYGLYVWHTFLQPIWMFYFSPQYLAVRFGTNKGTLLYSVLVITLSTLVALASYWLFERRFLALKNKFR